jgi:hypothetical protein
MFVAFMLVHLFWFFELKFGFEFKCLISFQNQQKTFTISSLTLSLFWPSSVSNHLQPQPSQTSGPIGGSPAMHPELPFPFRARRLAQLAFQPNSGPAQQRLAPSLGR